MMEELIRPLADLEARAAAQDKREAMTACMRELHSLSKDELARRYRERLATLPPVSAELQAWLATGPTAAELARRYRDMLELDVT
jgi:hypothetical protein